MNLKQKLAILAGIPIIGMLVLAGLGYLDLSQQANLTSGLINNQFVPLVERDIAELNQYQASVKTLLEADRDAYQSLVAEMSILQAAAGSDTSKSQEAHQENMQQVKDRVGKASKAFDDAMMAKYKIFQDQFEQWKALTNQTVAMAGSEETKAQAIEQSAGVTAKAFGAMRDTLDSITQLLDEKIAVIMGDVKTKKETAVKMGKDGQSRAETAIFIFALITLIVAVLSIALTIVLTLSITRPIRMVANGLDQGAHQLASASNEVSNSSQMLAEGTSEQAASLEQTSSSMEEMASMTKLNASNASQADSMMHEAAQTVSDAVNAMEKLRAAMDKINAASDETAKIIRTIDEIAFQTNLLALNAAVEAARAGEAGAGFAVVADEVRSLAMRAAEAARNTSTLIEQNINDIKIGTDLVRETDEVFVKVQEAAVKVAELVGEISAASSEQSQGIDQVNLAMGQMDGVTQQIAANAEEAAAASEELRAQSVSLQGYVVQLDKVLGKRHNESTPSPAAIKSKGKAAAGASAPEPKAAKMPEAKPLPAPETLDDGISDFEDF